MGRGKFKGKPTGRRQFSAPEEIVAGSSSYTLSRGKKLNMRKSYLKRSLEKNQEVSLKKTRIWGRQLNFLDTKERR